MSCGAEVLVALGGAINKVCLKLLESANGLA